uniref:Uncharacterized protein n=1 Tax=Arundo donax TaxID=35708 RepID=A0A0A9GGV0_ARUDO
MNMSSGLMAPALSIFTIMLVISLFSTRLGHLGCNTIFDQVANTACSTCCLCALW